MSDTNQHSNPDAEVVLAWMTRGYHKEGHHPNCRTRTDKGCDCYARGSAPARTALTRLVEQLETAERLGEALANLLRTHRPYLPNPEAPSIAAGLSRWEERYPASEPKEDQ